ncbi:hypothetical protein SCUCBS95973_001573 [Sporothrix curviconia]|uniref:Alternative oxidase n=1 Tax=Sporothrix curviconia TaxID=1260050 RepID=A0ABP0AZX3_9PEZI
MPIAVDMADLLAAGIANTQRTARQLLDKFSSPSFSYKPLADRNSQSTPDTLDPPLYVKPKWKQPAQWARWVCAATVVLLLLVWSVFFWHQSYAGPSVASLAEARRRLTKEQYIEAVLREPVEATTIILPRIGIRDENDLSNLGDQAHSTELSDIFDVDAFLVSWAAACPQVQVVQTPEEIPGLPDAKDAVRLEAWKMPGLEKIRNMVVDPANYRAAFDTWLVKSVPQSANMSSEQPLRVDAATALFQWHRGLQETDFARAFARLFVFNPTMRRLGASVLWHLEQRLGRPVVSDSLLFPSLVAPPASLAASPFSEPTRNTSLVTTLGHHRLVPDGFMGVHLRTASDAAKARWPGYESQAPAYINTTVEKNFSSIYIASGSPEHRARFVNDSAAHGVDVYWKEDLLAGTDDLEALTSLSWDQQAVVDLQVLLHAGFFIGMGRSSFTWSVAIRRSVIPESGAAFVDFGCFARATKDIPPEKGYVPDATSEIGLIDSLNVVLCDYLMRLAISVWQ